MLTAWLALMTVDGLRRPPATQLRRGRVGHACTAPGTADDQRRQSPFRFVCRSMHGRLLAWYPTMVLEKARARRCFVISKATASRKRARQMLLLLFREKGRTGDRVGVLLCISSTDPFNSGSTTGLDCGRWAQATVGQGKRKSKLPS